MQDPSAAWRVPFSARLFPESAALTQWVSQDQHKAWHAVSLAGRRAGLGAKHRHAYGVTLLSAGLPFSAWMALKVAEYEMKEAQGGKGEGPLSLWADDNPILRALRADFATSLVRCGLWSLAMNQLLEAHECTSEPDEEWLELAHRGETLSGALSKRNQERSLHRLRAAYFGELADRGEATPVQRLEQAKSLLALGDLDHSIADYDAAEDVLVPLGEDEALGGVALELLVGMHLRAGARDREQQARARKKLHRVSPHSAVLREGAADDEGSRQLRDLEVRHTAGILHFLSKLAGDVEPGPEHRSRLLLLARAHPDQPHCAVNAALAHLERGLLAQAQAALDLMDGPLSDADCEELAALGLTVAPTARIRKAAG
jgi:tetratricopeptide (TPR) repeat protein